tara:strand:+ start:1792 stop:2118 length:327 start_codon:yes stop_codon:yes gene_type:complete
MADTSRSSGVLTASAVVATNPCRLKSVHFSVFAGGPDVITIKVWDSKDATTSGNTELARFVVKQSQAVSNAEYDMHGVLAREGLYLQIANSAGSPDANTIHAVSVEFN